MPQKLTELAALQKGKHDQSSQKHPIVEGQANSKKFFDPEVTCEAVSED